MEDLLKKYNIRYQTNEKFIFDINFYDICIKLLNIDIIRDEFYINEDEFIELLLSPDNYLNDDVKNYYRKYIEIIDSIPDEIIKPLKGYEEDYSISNHGYIISKKSGKILKQHYVGDYYAVDIRLKKERDHENLHVHVLMAKTFLQKPTDSKIKYIVDHINGVKTDNRLENLRYTTYSDNNKNAYITGNKKKSGCLIVCRLNENGDVLERYDSINDASRQNNNIDSGDISKCCKGKRNIIGGYRWRYSKLNIKTEKEINLHDDEIFKPIPDIGGLKFSKYETSNYGKVRNIETGIILANRITRRGYEQITLYPDIGKRLTFQVQRIVAYTFLKVPKNAKILKVNHIDENPRNNCYKNLEWLTHRKNVVYSSGKSVRQIDIKTNKMICTFDSICAASRFIGKERYNPNIVACCKGKYMTAYGYKWEFADEKNIIVI